MRADPSPPAHNESTSAADAPAGRGVLEHLAQALAHALPAQAPIRDFVHHNTLHAFQHQPFRQAISAARTLWGHPGYLPESAWQSLFASGRINLDDLRATLAIARQSEPDLFDYASPAGIDAVALDLALLKLPANSPSAATLDWKINEERHPAAGDPLWQACCAAVDNLQKKSASAAAPGSHMLLADAAARLADELFGQFGQPVAERPAITWRELLQVLSGFDLMSDVQRPWIRLIAAGLDQGVAAWTLPGRERGLFVAWREGLGAPGGGEVGALLGGEIDSGGGALADLPNDALDAMAFILERYALPEERWIDYLTRLALRLPGWFGMQLQIDARASLAAGAAGHDAPSRLIDGLAILLAMEYVEVCRWVGMRWSLRPRLDMLAWYFREHPAELIVRHAAHASDVPASAGETLHGAALQLIHCATNPAEHDAPEWTALAHEILLARHQSAVAQHSAEQAYPLWQLALSLGLNADDLDPPLVSELLDAHRSLGAEQRAYLRLLAYERHYREDILGVLTANRLFRAQPARPAVPSAQLVFCMDDREEGLRRHLEEVAPDTESFGAAGFFGIAMLWRGLDDTVDSPLCPIVVSPAHRVREIATDADAGAHRAARRRRRLRLGRLLFHGTRKGLLGSALIPLTAWPLILFTLAGKTFFPRRLGTLLRAAVRRHESPVATALTLDADVDAPAGHPATPREGFDLDEQAGRIGSFLLTIGLTRSFAPLVVIMGHGSHSQNNPHRSAYDCGACGGKHGGPNARAFARLANRPEIRQRLAARGICIPETCFFIGAQHDTSDDTIDWFDAELLPATHRAQSDALRGALREATRRHALERCRRFASAPDRLNVDQAFRHAAMRGDDFSQARPELGHVTNACAIIGRRALSRGAFFDRRAFLISYDPTDDADGKIIESILLAAGPVGAGINLEYYFSTVNNDGYGCSSKVMHNLCGELGVIEGGNSDLRTGLPKQMIEIHEAMRLLVICEASPEILLAIVARQPMLAELIGNRWIVVASVDPVDGAIAVLDPRLGWAAWAPAQGVQAWPRCAGSLDWVTDATGALRRDALPTALINPQAVLA